jgi:multidrug resistance efflux pump
MVETTAADATAPAKPESADPPPPPKRPRGTFRKWRARFVVLVLVVAAVLLGLWISQSKMAKAAQIDLGTVTLTSQVVPVDTPRPGQVMSVDVSAGQKVTPGQQLGTLQVTTTNSQGSPVLSTITLSAPRAGIVVDDPVTVGSTLQPGQPLLQLYDPTKLTFVGEVALVSLPELSPGMIATLKAEGLKGSIKATVDRAVPRVGTSQTGVSPNFLRVVLLPMNQTDVARLLPGLRFTGTVDTGTGPRGRPKLVYTDA